MPTVFGTEGSMEELFQTLKPMESNDPTITIEMVWFSDGEIHIQTSDGKTFSQPLEVFPVLMEATQEQRAKYHLNKWRDSIHWPELDEDIHISSFFSPETVNYDNEVNHLFNRFPWLDLKIFASLAGMHWTKLARFRYGVWTPSEETLEKIKSTIRKIAKEMSAAAF